MSRKAMHSYIHFSKVLIAVHQQRLKQLVNAHVTHLLLSAECTFTFIHSHETTATVVKNTITSSSHLCTVNCNSCHVNEQLISSTVIHSDTRLPKATKTRKDFTDSFSATEQI